MSRILRRPMFRGGRVDSRGTGITSGLGYKQGGSVQARPGYYAGGIIAALNAAKNFIPAAYRGFKASRAYQPFSKNLGFMGRAKDLFKPKAGLSAPMAEKGAGAGFRTGSFLRSNPLTTGALLPQAIEKGYKAGDYALTEVLPGIAKPTADFLSKPIQKLFDFELFDDDPDKKTEEEIAIAEAAEKLKRDREFAEYIEKRNKNKVEEIKSEIGGKEQIDIDKKIFADALGKKKARIEDASNMALGFAGRAFEDDATVKSALGKFFADESKRPSAASKIDQAAGSAAINKYIKGEISKAELDKFFAQTDYKMSFASKKGKKNVASNIIEAAKSYGTGYKSVDYGLRMSFDNAQTNKMDASEGQTVDKVPLTVDNIGQIFIEDESPYRAVMITVNEENEIIRDPLN
jgi:hypothetical protein